MYAHLLLENERRRTEIPLWQLLCFVMFCVWQMGFIYFVGPALNIDGRTPLPISPDNLTVLIVAAYLCSIVTMIAAPKAVILLSRLSAAVALATAVGLFLPLDAAVLTLLIYTQCFACCYMIGFESATMVHYLTESSVTRHLLIAYPVGYTLIALIQSDFIPIDFSLFRILTVIMLGMLLLFYMTLPSKNIIRFVKKSDGLVLPKRLLCGFLLLAFLGALLGVIAPAAAAGVENGVFAAYIACAVTGVILYLLYRKTGRHPICFVAYIIGISAVGYVLLVVSEYVPSLGMMAAALIGVGMTACALIPLFSLLVVKQYPSKFLVPGYIGLCMLAVIVQSVLVEMFRESMMLLNISYLVVIVILAFIYISVEPFLLFSVGRKFEETAAPPPPAEEPAQEEPVLLAGSSSLCSLDLLTKREAEVVHLIGCGHSNGDIAKILFISEHTVKDHTKSIYRKLCVHSRFELMALVNRLNAEDPK